MRQTWLVFKKDVTRWGRDPLNLLLWAAIPLAVVLLMKLAFGGTAGMPAAQLVWVDQDDSLISQAMRMAFSQEQVSSLIETVNADSAEAMEILRAGEASAVAIIPPKFGDDYLNAKHPRIELIKNPAQIVLPKIIEETFAILIDGASYLQFVFEEPIQSLTELFDAEGAPPDSTVLALSEGIGNPLELAGNYLFPPVIGVDFRGEESGSPVASDGTLGREVGFLELFFPGALLMSLLFVAQILAIDFWVEDKQGTYARSLSGVAGGSGFVLGKVLAGVLLLTLIYILLLLIGRFGLRIHLNNLLPAALYLGACSFGFVAVINYLAVFARTQKGATVLSSLVIMPLVILGGSFFPLEAMPDGLRQIGERTPNGMVSEQLKLILFERDLTTETYLVLGVSLLVGSLFIFLTDRQARRRFVGV